MYSFYQESNKYKPYRRLNDHVFKVFEIKHDYFFCPKLLSMWVKWISNIEKHSLKVLSGVVVV